MGGLEKAKISEPFDGNFSPFFARRKFADISFFFGAVHHFAPRTCVCEKQRGKKITTQNKLDDNAPRNERVLFLLLPISYSFVTASRPVFSN